MSTDREGQVDQRAQLRLGAAIALTSTLLLLPVQAFSTPRAQLPVLLVVYALHTVVSGGVLLATFARRDARFVDRLSIVFVGGISAEVQTSRFQAHREVERPDVFHFTPVDWMSPLTRIFPRRLPIRSIAS